MFKNLKSQVIVEVITAPLTLALLTLGGTLMMGAPFSRWFLFSGLLSTLAGIGSAISNFFLNKEEIANKALKKTFDKELADRHERAKTLLVKLRRTTEDKDDKCLEDLCSIYFDFLTDVQEKKIQNIPEGLLEQLELLFDACTKSLEHSFVLAEQAGKLSPDLRKKAMSKRKQILEEVANNVAGMFDNVSQIRMLGLKDNTKDLERIRNRVQRSLNLAQELDQLCTEADEGTERKYSEYVKE